MENKNSHYAELRCKSTFSFLRGASHADELVERAVQLHYHALAIADRHTLAGVVRMHGAAEARGLKLVIGAEIVPVDAPPLLPVSDAVVLSSLVDGVVFVADANKSPRGVVREGVARLEAAHVTTLGVVLNRVSENDSPYFRYASDFADPPKARATA